MRPTKLIAVLLLASLAVTFSAEAASLQKSDGFNPANNVSTYSLAMGSNVTAGSAITVWVISYANASPPTATVSSLTDTRGNTYTQIAQSPVTSPTHTKMFTYYCLASTSGANTISVTMSASVFGLGLAYTEVPSAASTYKVDSIGSAAATQSPTVGTITDSNASGLIVAYTVGWSQSWTGGGAGWTYAASPNGNAFQERAGGGTYTLSWTSSAADDWNSTAIAFSPTLPATFPGAIINNPLSIAPRLP